jgi:DNA topoisomerase-1
MLAPAGSGLTTPSGARVPPAWTRVWMTTDPRSALQATGYDVKGRRVHLYSAEHMGRANAAKFSRLKAFGRVYPTLVRKLGKDMKTSEEALVLFLISKTGFRIGSNTETLAAVKAFGASTLRCSHVHIHGSRLEFNFPGKKGVWVSKVLRNNFLAREIAGRCGGTDNSIFRTSDAEVRAYLNSIPGGSDFLVKDFRTYLGTLTALRKMRSMPPPRSVRELKRLRKEVGETVGRELGNSYRIALNSYVAPEVFAAWETVQEPEHERARTKSSALVKKFLECVHYDRDVPASECRDSDPFERRV